MSSEVNRNDILILTNLTGRVTQSRRVIVKGFDLPLKNLITFFIALPPAIIVIATLWPFFGTWAVVGGMLVEAAFFWFIHSKTQLGVSRYQGFKDKNSANVGQVFIGTSRIDLKALTTPVVQKVSAVEKQRARNTQYGLPGHTSSKKQSGTIEDLIF